MESSGKVALHFFNPLYESWTSINFYEFDIMLSLSELLLVYNKHLHQYPHPFIQDKADFNAFIHAL